jgi:hypothetical protein
MYIIDYEYIKFKIRFFIDFYKKKSSKVTLTALRQVSYSINGTVAS